MTEQKQGGTWSRRSFLAQSAVSLAGVSLQAQQLLRQPLRASAVSPFLLGWTGGTLTSLRFHGDRYPTEYIAPGERLGHVLVTWRRAGGAWNSMDSKAVTAENRQVLSVTHAGCAARYTAGDEQGKAMEVEVRLQPDGDALRWTLRLRNLSATPVEVGDLALPLPMHTEFKGGAPPTASVLKHSFVSGHGSFLFWMRSNSIGPYLLMTPEPTTALEYWERTPPHKDVPAEYRVYLHSSAQGEKMAAEGGRWRQPHTSVTLAPAGKAGSHRDYGFRLAWVESYAEIEQTLAASGLLDVQIAPGMTVPTDLFVEVALRSRNAVAALQAEHPEQTTVEPLGRRGAYQHYRVRFARLGENLLTVRQADGRTTLLEFFATEPLEMLIQKRGSFVAAHQQQDTTKWYRGLLAEWNMDSQVMLGPDNYDRIKSWRIYEVTCDDPGLSKPAFLASKLAEFPDQAQATALDDYIEHFVWGGLQRSTAESDSYGIYGILDWKRNRDSPDTGDKGQRHLWRPYDYPHLIVMYWGMYRMARDFPGVQTRLTRAEYLERTYGTALALFTVPRRIINWEAYQTGFYNEVVIPAIIDELEAVGKTEQAATLRKEWEQKVRYFLTGGPDLFGSEYAFDSTGFESTQAIARYAADRPAVEGVTAQQTRAFAVTQMQANLFCRGVVEKSYFYYGSDYRQEAGDAYVLSYMAQMGGWAVLDHALHDGMVPDATVRLGYASYLSAWALMNTGTAASNYGYWYPGAGNDGGAGGGFEPAAKGMTWLGQPHHRGSWYYSCEEDLGFCGALRTSRTIVANDPVFGRFCFGGTVQDAGGTFTVSPRDGVRRRFSLRTPGHSLDVEVQGARFAAERSIQCEPEQDRWTLVLERDARSSGRVQLSMRGLQAKAYRVRTPESETTVSCAGGWSIELTTSALEMRVEVRPA